MTKLKVPLLDNLSVKKEQYILILNRNQKKIETECSTLKILENY